MTESVEAYVRTALKLQGYEFDQATAAALETAGVAMARDPTAAAGAE